MPTPISSHPVPCLSLCTLLHPHDPKLPEDYLLHPSCSSIFNLSYSPTHHSLFKKCDNLLSHGSVFLGNPVVLAFPRISEHTDPSVHVLDRKFPNIEEQSTSPSIQLLEKKKEAKIMHHAMEQKKEVGNRGWDAGSYISHRNQRTTFYFVHKSF